MSTHDQKPSEEAVMLLEAAMDGELLLRDIRIKRLEQINSQLAARIDELEAEKKK